MNTDTIYALSSAYGKAGVSVFRISGQYSYKILEKLTNKTGFKANNAKLVSIFHPKTKELLDKCIVIFFASPNSYTGEDTVELYIHGSIAIIESIYNALSFFKNTRLATPGEFTKRAFLNNKLDLTEVEAVSDLIESETFLEQKLALSNINGISSKLYNNWRNKLLTILAWSEASIDFSTDEIPENIDKLNTTALNDLIKDMNEHIKTNSIASKIQNGLNVVIIGKPNVGKSSLFNKLLGENKAIVSNIAGTTRDILEATIDIDGNKINLIDTAGLNEITNDKIEKIGIKKAKLYAKNADIKIYIITNLKDLDKKQITKNTIILLNKIDKLKQIKNLENIIPISIKTGENWNIFINLLKKTITSQIYIPNNAILTKERYKTAINNCIKFLNLAKNEKQLDIKIENIRLATDEIGSITGKIYFNELLDKIFSSFCLGK